MTGPTSTILADRGVLRLAGDDTRTFLQGLISNDVDALSPERALYAALLTPQGKYLFDFLLYEQDGAVLLDAEAARLTELARRLTMYRLRAEVTIEDASVELAVLAVWGDGAATAFALPETPGAARAEDGAVVAVDPRLAALGVRALVPRERIEAFAQGYGLGPGTPEAYDLHRLRLGVPDGSRDLVPQKSILLESSFEELNGVSFAKGCYVGQELTARTKHRGLVKRRLVPVRLAGPLPPPGTIVTAGGAGPELGEIRSGRDGWVLASLRLEAIREDGPRPLTADGTALTPVLPAWMGG